MTADSTPGTPGMTPAGRYAAVRAPVRGPVFGARYAIATEHYAASLAGMNALQRGANAIDAAITASAVNCVVKPYATHLGGDAFVLIWHRKSNTVECLNAGGRAPHRATPDAFAEGIPQLGARASTVPGFVDAWAELHARHGSRPLDELLAPAIDLAEGFPVSLHLSQLTAALARANDLPSNEIARLFLNDGKPYRPGETLRQPELAQTLRAIARDGRDGFYGGPAGRAIADAMSSASGLIDAEDLSEPAAHWHEPISTSYHGCTVYEQALPSQGIILLEALNIIEQFPIADWGLASADAAHVMIEAVRIAFEDSRRYSADPQEVDVPVDVLLSKEHARSRAAEIDLSRTRARGPAPVGSDTTSFAVADEDTAVCFIQSVFRVWGSSFAIPGTGVLMNNRLTGFNLDPSHPNYLAPRKRTVHTLNNFLVVRDGELVIGGGTPGADFQVQCNLQTIAGAVDWLLEPYSAINAPRWAIQGDNAVAVESRFPEAMASNLERRGHRVRRSGEWDSAISRSSVVASNVGGGWLCASDLRSEGLALAQ